MESQLEDRKIAKTCIRITGANSFSASQCDQLAIFPKRCPSFSNQMTITSQLANATTKKVKCVEDGTNLIVPSNQKERYVCKLPF